MKGILREYYEQEYVFVPVPYCLDNCGFVVEPKSGRMVPPKVD